MVVVGKVRWMDGGFHCCGAIMRLMHVANEPGSSRVKPEVRRAVSNKRYVKSRTDLLALSSLTFP